VTLISLDKYENFFTRANMLKTGIIICGHGSRSKSAESEFGSLAVAVRKRFPDIPVEYGFWNIHHLIFIWAWTLLEKRVSSKL
jgi:hypothetical protein